MSKVIRSFVKVGVPPVGGEYLSSFSTPLFQLPQASEVDPNFIIFESIRISDAYSDRPSESELDC